MGILDLVKKPKEQTPPPSPKYKILVVDDDQYLRELYQELLAGEGYDVLTANDGEQALESVSQNPPNLIILDIIMPKIDGNVVLRKLWDNEQTRKIPVIILTNAGDIKNMDYAKFYSAYQFLNKANITPDEIVKTAAEALHIKKSGTS